MPWATPQASEVAVGNSNNKDNEGDASKGAMGNSKGKWEASECTMGNSHVQVKSPWATATMRRI